MSVLIFTQVCLALMEELQKDKNYKLLINANMNSQGLS